jgi:hypothetical protein
MTTRVWSPRAQRVMAAVRANFIKWNHRPSADHMQALAFSSSHSGSGS